ncbi:hypothetical protein EZS27_007937 [termite gut metagenome]|uniref:Uncharacterized protein n=1 Tax=termite gut metagenome TaxID=433724 RepID=A0A5J4SF85_9ZZZZ
MTKIRKKRENKHFCSFFSNIRACFHVFHVSIQNSFSMDCLYLPYSSTLVCLLRSIRESKKSIFHSIVILIIN